MSTTVTLIADVEAVTRAAAERAVLHGDALPRWPVVLGPADGCPPGTEVSIANKSWEIDEAHETGRECSHGCGPLNWVDDTWCCPVCGDEFAPDDETGGS